MAQSSKDNQVSFHQKLILSRNAAYYISPDETCLRLQEHDQGLKRTLWTLHSFSLLHFSFWCMCMFPFRIQSMHASNTNIHCLCYRILYIRIIQTNLFSLFSKCKHQINKDNWVKLLYSTCHLAVAESLWDKGRITQEASAEEEISCLRFCCGRFILEDHSISSHIEIFLFLLNFNQYNFLLSG